MKILGWEITNTNIAIAVGAVLGGGACYAIIKYLLSTKSRNISIRKRIKGRGDGERDWSLPLFLEQEYGSFRQVCFDSDPVAARYLQEIPDHFFAFPQNFLKFVSNFVTEHTKEYRQALVVGSRTGFLVFALGTIFDEVKGLESSFSQVVTCFQFQNFDTVTHQFPSEGAQKTQPRSFKSPISVGGLFPPRRGGDIRRKNKENVEFINIDIGRQPLSVFGEFQLLIIQNCLEDLENPLAFLSSLKNFVVDNGFLIISADYNWSNKLNPAVNGTNLGSFDLLKSVLQNEFKFEEEKDIPEVLCESIRSCKVRYNHVTAWSRIKDQIHKRDLKSVENMEGPALKRPKLQLRDAQLEEWKRWSNNLEILQTNLISGCLCHIDTIELQRPIFPYQKDPDPVPEINPQFPSSSVDPTFIRDYTIQFISGMHLLSDAALQQQAKGFICQKIMDMASGVAMDEGIWEMLIEYLDSSDKFVTLSTSKCLVSLLMWTRLPNLNEIFDTLFSSVMVTTNNPLKLSQILDIIRGVVEYKYESEHPLEIEEQNQESQPRLKINRNTTLSDVNMVDISEISNPNNSSTLSVSSATCLKVEVDTEIETEVKVLCVKALENWWNRLLEKFQNMMAHFEQVNESPTVTFLDLWLSIISVKNNLSVIDTKHYYMHLEAFVPLLNPNSPPIVWRKLADVFNEILCYGSTLSLQDIPNEEPCDLAHLIIRCVRSRQFLQGIPYSKNFSGFGGSTVGPVNWDFREWESEDCRLYATPTKCIDFLLLPGNPSSSSRLQDAIPSSSKSISRTPRPHYASQADNSLPPSTGLPIKVDSESSSTCVSIPSLPSEADDNKPKSSALSTTRETPMRISQTNYIGPSIGAVQLENSYSDSLGDRPLLQKIILLVLKSVAVTVQETHVDESDSGDEESASMEESAHSESESEVNDMAFVEKSIREVFLEMDLYVKSIQPFHPSTSLGEWVVKLFSDQDDALIEAMLCILDTYKGFIGKIDIPPDFKEMFHPVKSFITLLSTISYDKDVLLDWLMGNETCFLLYMLSFLKFAFKNWTEFVECSGRDFDSTMNVLIRLRISVGRLVERSLFPYNINPVLRLLERCEELYESSNRNGGSSINSNDNV